MIVTGVCDGCNIRKEVTEILQEDNNQQKIVLYCKECFKK